MNYIRTASFGGLFTTTFLVSASFQVACTLLGLIMALVSPGLFKMNGVPATSPVGAIGVLIFLLCFGLFVNAAISALGAAVVLGWRRFLPVRSQRETRPQA